MPALERDGVRRRRGVKVVEQRKNWDCGVAALTMLLKARGQNVEYADVSAIVRTNALWSSRHGMLTRHIEAAAAAFGVQLRVSRRRHGYLDGIRLGILGIIGGRMNKAGHWVVLKDGATVVDPSGGEVWTLADYLAVYRARPSILFTIADHDRS